MKGRLLAVTACFAGVILVISLLLAYTVKKEYGVDKKAENIVALNEISQLSQMAASNKDTSSQKLLQEKIAVLDRELRLGNSPDKSRLYQTILIIGAGAILYLLLIFLYIYFSILRPFDKLKGYAENISSGICSLQFSAIIRL
ncbi:hypothetical protein [Anaerocolumna jejuensis]|uniref:hypothetical protein n=1 Tax=Anaerocolumna jejuensis TaxID=259063 RepID=UPI003F7B8337